jgi:NAD(P)-dependent dehydrogenase (short-subunit alcohol dehydrogenase family)
MDAAARSFDGLTALVTGSTSGIGLALSDAIEQRGGTVIRHGLGLDGAFGQDLGQPGAGATLAAAALGVGAVDILVLCASLQIREPWLTITADQVESQLRVNLYSALELMQGLTPGMVDRGWGRILTIGSVQQRQPHRDMLVYAASKAAQFNIVINLAKLLAPSGVTVNNLSPGVIDTPRNTAALASQSYLTETISHIPAGRIGLPEDCVPAALLLCSSESNYITGQDIAVDGGFGL